MLIRTMRGEWPIVDRLRCLADVAQISGIETSLWIPRKAE